MTDPKLIRNFSIIAHIDHGKSTLADQFLLKTGAITPREFRAQVLDDMDLERERGITIQMHPVTIYYEHAGTKYELNLIDTPGHVDFNYEVSRSLAACEGAILLVDAFQGVQAQTVANAFLAMDAGLKVIPALNKIDLPQARPDFVVGDTVTDAFNPPAEPLAGYKEPKPMVYSGLYPVNNNEFEDLREALAKLKLNDSSFTYSPEVSDGLGFGFRCGFLGMLHREIIQQRLERDSELELVQTAPNVTYEVLTRKAEVLVIDNPQKVPEAGQIEEFREPVVRISFLLPADNIGDLMQLCTDRRGTYVRTEYLSPTRAILVYEMPLAEVIYDLYDKLKSVTHGYGTMDYDLLGYRPEELVRLDILVAGKRVDALSTIVHRGLAERRGRKLVKKLRGEIDRHLFEIAIQAAIGSRVIARESIAPIKKNVTAKCYGGDITRKRKLWAKQAEGKKRMKQVGQVEIPQEAFLAVLEADQ